MTTLREQFIRELVIRGTSPRTQESYAAAVYGLAKHYRKAPDQIGEEQLKDYMFYLAQERKLAPASLNLTICALRSFYQLVLQRPVEKMRLSLPWVAKAIHRPRVYSGKAPDGGLSAPQTSCFPDDGLRGRAAAQRGLPPEASPY
jgi:site-specific recombinase XerC